jgi:hypothetical protein
MVDIPDGSATWDGYDSAIIGVSTDGIVVYDLEGIIKILMERDSMDYEEAQEFIDYNIVGAHIGDTTPILVNLCQND